MIPTLHLPPIFFPVATPSSLSVRVGYWSGVANPLFACVSCILKLPGFLDSSFRPCLDHAIRGSPISNCRSIWKACPSCSVPQGLYWLALVAITIFDVIFHISLDCYSNRQVRCRSRLSPSVPNSSSPTAALGSYPSIMADTTIASPFRLSYRDTDRLERNEAFAAMREHLRRQELGMQAPRYVWRGIPVLGFRSPLTVHCRSFCSFHRQSCSNHAQATFRLHRDIIHTLLLPLVLLHHQASRTAASVLPDQKGLESERAFRGEARSAYAWLHCVLTEEHDSYLTERCPACIVLHVLNSEPTIRFVAVACLLADHLQGLDMLNSKRRLPSFDFWFEALETAVREDPFWGDDFWPDIEYRACTLTDGVKQLVLQCLELRAVLDRQTLQSQASYKANSHLRRDASRQQAHPIAVKTSRMTGEEQKWLGKVAASRCLQSYRNDRTQRFHTRRHGDPRSRSVTS